jgi:hypothetical protein
MQKKTVPNDYIKWRLSQGFSFEQANFIFRTLDGNKNKQVEVFSWLKSNEKIRGEFWSRSNSIIIAAQRTIYQRNDLFAEKLLPRLMLTLPRVETATQQAMYGKYYDAMVLLRTAIEGFLRFTMDLVYEFRFQLLDILESLDDDSWKDSRKTERALTIGPMCNWLRKMKIAGKPAFNTRKETGDLYKYLEIDRLNRYIHSNVLEVLDHNDGEFDQNNFDEFVKLHRKAIESFIIIWQNLSDKIDYNESPILELGVDFQSEEMPLLTKVIEKRGKN